MSQDKFDDLAERLLPMITEFGNAEFQCGEWADGDRTAYDEWKAIADKARANLLTAVAAELRKLGEKAEKWETWHNKLAERFDAQDLVITEQAERIERLEAAIDSLQAVPEMLQGMSSVSTVGLERLLLARAALEK